MDTAKIRSLVPSVDLAIDARSGRASDGDIVVGKVATLLALDSLLVGNDSDPRQELPGGHPPASVVVDLMLPRLSAEAARQLARTLADPPDYSHLDPHKPHPERTLAQAASALADELEAPRTALLPGPFADRAAHAIATSPGERPDLHPQGVQHWRESNPHLAAPAPRTTTSAAAQARDSERLAGLALAAERVAGTPVKLGALTLAAAVLGALIVIALI